MTVRSAIVLAAGEGSRLRPLTKHRPKPMLPAATDPILECVFDRLIDAGIEHLTVVVGYRRDTVQSHFGPSYRDVPIDYVFQESQLGSGHALQIATSAVDETTLVVNGDQLVATEIITETIETHDSESAATLGVIPHSDVSNYGGVIVDPDGTITDLVECPTDSRHYRLNAGVYVFEPETIEEIVALEPVAGELSLVDGLKRLLERGETITAAAANGMWIDATYPWDLLEVAETLLETETLEGSVSPTAQVHESATIADQAIVGPDCVVGPGAVVGPNVCLRENVTVGANATISRSVVDMDSRLGPNATVLDCVTGRGVHIGPGSTVVGGPGDVHVGRTIHRDERLGAVVADRTRDHGGVTYAPGSVVGANVTIHAGSTIRGSIESETEVR